jgi:hypothetical protein
MSSDVKTKKAISTESFIFLAVFSFVVYFFCSKMGTVNVFSTMMKTSYRLLIDTVFFIMALAVLAGAIGSLFSEFGIIAMINKLLCPLMKPLYDLPGAAAIGVVTCYISDNPAIISLANDKGFKRYFKKYQFPSLTNISTAFGMGLVVTTFMMAQKAPQGENFIKAAMIGDLGAVVGSIVSVRIMQFFTKKAYGTEAMADEEASNDTILLDRRVVREGSVGKRILESLLEGGKSGVDVGLSIIPGVLVICTLVFMLTNGPSKTGVYTGAAFEGIPVLPWIGDKLSFIFKPLLGFKSAKVIAFPITSLGAVGAALSLVPQFLSEGIIRGNEVAVFTAMGMCWSGYLSTHVAMMDALGYREMTGKAILSHTIGGFCAGIAAHFLYLIL